MTTSLFNKEIIKNKDSKPLDPIIIIFIIIACIIILISGVLIYRNKSIKKIFKYLIHGTIDEDEHFDYK